MWLAGVVSLLVGTSALALLLNRQPRIELAPLIWDVPRVAATYTTILGALSGFSVVSAIFIANLAAARESAEYESVIGMFILGFVTFLGTAMQYGTTPNRPDENDATFLRMQGIAFCYANFDYYLGIGLSWLALRLLLLSIGLQYVADVFTWILFFAVFSGGLRTAHWLQRLTTLDRRACLATRLIGFSLAAIYGFGLAELFEDLLPANHQPFLIAVVCFSLAAAVFSIHSALLAFGDEPLGQRLLSKLDGVTLVVGQSVVTSIGLLWVVVAKA